MKLLKEKGFHRGCWLWSVVVCYDPNATLVRSGVWTLWYKHLGTFPLQAGFQGWVLHYPRVCITFFGLLVYATWFYLMVRALEGKWWDDFLKCICFKVGRGDRIRFWLDRWCGHDALCPFYSLWLWTRMLLWQTMYERPLTIYVAWTIENVWSTRVNVIRQSMYSFYLYL